MRVILPRLLHSWGKPQACNSVLSRGGGSPRAGDVVEPVLGVLQVPLGGKHVGPEAGRQPMPGMVDRSHGMGDRLLEFSDEDLEFCDQLVEGSARLVAHDSR